MDGKPEDAAERTFEQIKADVMAEPRPRGSVRSSSTVLIDIIVFNRLNEDEIAQIVEIGMLRKVAARMQDMEITMDWTEAAKKHLAKAGFDPVYGARSLRRAVTNEVEDLLLRIPLRARSRKAIA